MTQPLWRHRDFLLFAVNRLAVIVAFQMMTVAVGWQVYTMTHRPLDLGLTGLMQFLPVMILFPVTGWTADRVPRKRILGVCQVGFAVTAALLFLLARYGAKSVGPIYATLLVLGTARAFSSPTVSTLLLDIVGKELFPRVIPVNSFVFEIATISGPPIGGLLFAYYGAATVYAVACLLFLVGAVVLLPVRASVRRSDGEAQDLAAFFAGVRYVFQEKLLLGIVTLDLFAVFFGGVPALLPIFAKDILLVGPSQLGLLRSAPAVGAAFMAIALALFPLRHRAGRQLFASVMVFGISTIVFGFSNNYWLSLGCLVVLGAADLVSVTIRAAVVQLATPENMRGRVAAVNYLFIGTSNELGEFESGVTADWWGPRWSAAVGGLITCGVVLLCGAAFPSLRRMNRFDELKPEVLP